MIFFYYQPKSESSAVNQSSKQLQIHCLFFLFLQFLKLWLQTALREQEMWVIFFFLKKRAKQEKGSLPFMVGVFSYRGGNSEGKLPHRLPLKTTTADPFNKAIAEHVSTGMVMKSGHTFSYICLLLWPWKRSDCLFEDWQLPAPVRLCARWLGSQEMRVCLNWTLLFAFVYLCGPCLWAKTGWFSRPRRPSPLKNIRPLCNQTGPPLPPL